MSFFRNLFSAPNQSELDFLSLKCNFLDAELTKAEVRINLLEKAIKAERAAKDRVILRFGDLMSERQKNHGLFTKDAEKADSPHADALTIYDDEMEAKIRFAAEAMREDDIVRDVEPEELSRYIALIRKNPAQYILN